LHTTGYLQRKSNLIARTDPYMRVNRTAKNRPRHLRFKKRSQSDLRHSIC